jgi:ferredoxin
MFLRARSEKRPVQLGAFPLEILPRDASLIAAEAALPSPVKPEVQAGADPLSRSLDKYRYIFAKLVSGKPAAALAPLPDDIKLRTGDVKGFAYFMDANQVGICRIPENAWIGSPEAGLDHAIVLLVEHGRVPEKGNLARRWIEPAVQSAADMRAAEIAVVIAGHIRQMGYEAQCSAAGYERLDAKRLAVMAGIAVREGDSLKHPWIGDGFSLAVVATNYALETDVPLASSALREAQGLRYWFGINGAQSGRERARRMKRPSHLSRYPMETVKRVDRPTTLILDEEVPRVPKRAAFFDRALAGDLGEKAQKERGRFAFKHPTSWSLLQPIRQLVPHQNGEVAADRDSSLGDPEANAKAIKSLSYFLGSDLTGICEIPRYAWFSHKENGAEIPMYHRYAIVMLIDQGYDTMEGASGDDWISGTQSMRGYLRGAEIAGVMADFLRQKGYSSRSQTNADSDVLHIPLVLWAGLGEMSRIGELVLNPFVGPRFKSVVLTTDLPLAVDKPIDFGLQTFCNNCLKCARECPCDAIPFGPKVMFNGYEIWKPDVERCTRYRLTNMKGAACGRCMKTCPINKVVDLDGPLLTRAASWLGVNAMWLKPVMAPLAAKLDDSLGHGVRNPAKKWWHDHEIVNGVTVEPKGTNRRDIDPGRKVDAEKMRTAYYHADMMPPPNIKGPYPLDRKAGLAAAAMIETPQEALARVAAGKPAPAHYRPTPPLVESAVLQQKDSV